MRFLFLTVTVPFFFVVVAVSRLETKAANASLQRNKQRLHAARAQGDAHAASVSTGKMEAVRERRREGFARVGMAVTGRGSLCL